MKVENKSYEYGFGIANITTLRLYSAIFKLNKYLKESEGLYLAETGKKPKAKTVFRPKNIYCFCYDGDNLEEGKMFSQSFSAIYFSFCCC